MNFDIDDKPHWEFGYQDLDESVPDCTSQTTESDSALSPLNH